ncbi:ABC-type Fe3+-hydroxamate transport system substrate-binding protein [Paraburkholderia sp. GAS199]|uniref:ABC transporter substrate-binding protein n=1 Tax=Paraburkholderia sp. GAS199 TaxID=3035126 RepID=UPI003D23F935
MSRTAPDHANEVRRGRRRVLGGWAAALLAPLVTPLVAPLVATAAPSLQTKPRIPRRVVTLNWELTETLLALGRAPVGTSLPDWYTSTIVAPPLPPGVADIGLLYQPNFEVLLGLAPDLMIVTPGHAGVLPALQRIAPTLTLGAYMNDPQPYARLCEETRTMANAFDADARAAQLIDSTQRVLTDVRQRIAENANQRRHPVIVADAIDDRHLRVYGSGSLFDAMLRKTDVVNAANPPVSANGVSARWTTNIAGSALVSLPRLMDVPDASVLLVGPLKDDVRAALAASPLWRVLPAARERRVAVLPVIAPYGGLVSMQRFAAAVESALVTIAAGRGGLA